jgi:hypothetical protein
MWGLLIANHLDQSLWSTNQKYWAAVRSNLLHSFLEVHNCVAAFTSHGKLHEFGAEKPISWAKLAHFDVFAINFTVWSHILRSGGDALIILSSSYFRILLPWVQGTNKDDPFKGEPYQTITIKHFEVFLLAHTHMEDSFMSWKCRAFLCWHLYVLFYHCQHTYNT